MKAAIYSRKSKFTGKGDSIENQVQMCKEYMNRNYLGQNHQFEIFEDEGFGGGDTNRPEFQKLLEEIKSKKFDVLVCYRLDRISRNVSDFSSTLELLQEYNVDFISIKEQFDTSTPMGRAMVYISSVFAQLERETIAERVRDNMLELAKSGRWLGGTPPIGFKSKRITYLDGEYKERSLVQLVPDPKKLEFIKFISDKYEEVGSVHKIRKYYLQNNIKTKNGSDYSLRLLADTLRNPAYVRADKNVSGYLESKGINVVGNTNNKNGILVYNKKDKKNKQKDKSEWIAAVAKHEGIIDATRWLKIQKTLDQNGFNKARGTSKVALLTGIIRCKHCGSPMRITYSNKNKSGEKNHYYACNMKFASGGTRCTNKNLNGARAEQIIIDKIKELTKNKGMLIKELKKTQSELNTSSSKSEIEILNKKITGNESSIKNLVKQLSQNQNSIASKYIISEIENLNNETEQLKSNLEKLKNKNSEVEMTEVDLELIISNLSKFGELIDKADNNQKKYLISSIVDTIYWDADTGELEIDFFGKRKKK
ncbi:recombinase family protein [Clostridium botulinum]|uniref:recombinase family protein n=1 Tax=Clostridium botulinum TaxID=1491 RepID=UPI0013F022DA|nr:recombinase family protein [Clostridium botulinum]MBY6950298.1 recombinase family protein [Clostridium botulinum]MCR1138547.1 recombinase family protein [Clostridium botulinum]NEZ80098.1 recombinase family protein [Clostridium botulinum]NFA16743.1 recombinase family protein [Clostridium botulinum]NFA54164.1 recombinase family protein [Clostridium botulinum]